MRRLFSAPRTPYRSSVFFLLALWLGACSSAKSTSATPASNSGQSTAAEGKADQLASTSQPAVSALAPLGLTELSPILVFGDDFATRMTAGAEKNWYAIRYHDDSMTLLLNVSKPKPRPVALKRPVPTTKIRGHDAFGGQNEGGYSISWIEEGLSFDLEVECAAVDSDSRCKDASFLEGVAAGLKTFAEN